MQRTIPLNPQYDQNELLTESLRNTGAWCSMHGTTGGQHYFIAKNPSIDTAISLCGAYIKPFKALHIITPDYKCLACELFREAKEVTYKRTVKSASQMMNERLNQNQNLEE